MDDQTLCLMCDNLIRQLLMKGNCDPGDDIPHHGKKDILSCSAAACQVCRLILGHLDREPADDLTYSISKSFTRSFTFDVMTSEGWAYCCYLCQPYSFASSDGTTSGHDVGLEEEGLSCIRTRLSVRSLQRSGFISVSSIRSATERNTQCYLPV
jgi:hypothetical protein